MRERMKPLVFHLGVTLLLFFLIYQQWFLYRRAIDYVSGRGWTPGVKHSVVFGVRFFFILMLLPYLYRLFLGRPSFISSPWFIYGVFYPFGIWSLGSVVIFLFLFLAVPLRRLKAKLSYQRMLPRVQNRGSELEAPGFSRRAFMTKAVGFSATAPFLVSTYGVVYARTAFEVVKVDMPITSLPRELIGFRIVQLSDIHAGPFITEQHMVKIVTEANRLSPDLIVVTGDIIHSSKDFIPSCMRALSRLRARYGIYACMGNHEYLVDPDTVRRAVEAIGIRMLINEGRILTIGKSKLNLSGIDDLGYGAPDLRGALEGLDPAAPTLLLSHRPEAFPSAARHGVNFILSGHYHGGQVKVKAFGVSFTPVRLLTKYIEGTFRIGTSRLYVSRGLGTTGTPVRLGSRPELTLFRLVGA